MTLYQFTIRFDHFVTFFANAVVCVAAIHFYRQRPMRSVLLIAISSGMGAVHVVLPWLAEEPTLSSRGFYYLGALLSIAEMVMWAVGICWFFREYERRDPRPAA